MPKFAECLNWGPLNGWLQELVTYAEMHVCTNEGMIYDEIELCTSSN
jgi:hypothetical protein